MTGSLKSLGSRAIIGAFFKRLEEVSVASWVPQLASQFSSNQETETYKWLGDVPTMELWKGPRTRKNLKDFGINVTNQKYSAGLEVDQDDWRRDKTGQILLRVRELATRAAQLPARLLSKQLVDNAVAYDGVALYHASGHVNDHGDTIVTASSVAAATGTTPTTAEMETAIMQAIETILGVLDDEGEPRNDSAMEFAIMVPTVYWKQLLNALRADYTSAGVSNQLKSLPFTIRPIMNPRLAAPYMYVFRTDADVKALIWQDEVATEFAELTEGSELSIMHDLRAYYVKRVCAAGVGRYDQTHRIQFT